MLGSQAVLNAMASACIRQLVYASSLGIYAARGPGRTRNRRPYARRRGTDSGASRRALTRCDPPVTVVLWPQRPTPHEYRRYRAALAGHARVLAAGPGWACTAMPDSVVTMHDLIEALELLS